MWMFIVGLVLVVGLLMLGVYATMELPALRRWLLGDEHPPSPATETVFDVTPPIEEGLVGYPKRLEHLEQRLVNAIEEAARQRAHLETRAAEVGVKKGREELAERYTSDAAMLAQRAASMRRVLALVWKTRAVLSLRAHLAVTARRRPALDGFPDPASLDTDLARSGLAYEAASADVRTFLEVVRRRGSELESTVPPAPYEAELSDEIRAVVQDELGQVQAMYADLEERMDNLADTLGYLADSCRTREVVAGAPSGLELESGSEALMDEVSDALTALTEMAQMGDQHLADAAVDNLAEDISHLERAGLEAQAEAEAALEVARLLEQFQR